MDSCCVPPLKSISDEVYINEEMAIPFLLLRVKHWCRFDIFALALARTIRDAREFSSIPWFNDMLYLTLTVR